MLTPPILEGTAITTTAEQPAAVVHVVVARAGIRDAMGPAIDDVLAALQAQGIRPSGPLFSVHDRLDPAEFDFRVGFPIEGALEPTGRVEPYRLPSCRAARTTYVGPYEGLHAAWEAFDEWIVEQGETPGPSLWERYIRGPESGNDASAFRTELVRPVDA